MPSRPRAPRFPPSTVRATRLVESCLALLARRGPSDLPANPSHVLVVEPFGLGDCLFVNGMIGAMRRAWSRTVFHVICRPQWTWLFEACPDTRVHPVDVPWVAPRGARGRAWLKLAETARGLRRLECDIGFDVRGDIRSHALLMACGCRERIGQVEYAGSNVVLRGRLLTRAPRYVHEHRARQNLRLLESAGVAQPRFTYQLPAVRRPDRRFPLTIDPGAGWRFKRWKEERWAQLMNRLAEHVPPPFQLLAHSSEREIVDDIARQLDRPAEVTIADSLPELATALTAGEVFIGLDSGPLHLASALGVPVVGLYGPGIIDLFRPLGRDAQIVSRQDQFDCSPCLQRHCAHPLTGCMDAIGVDDVVRAFLQAGFGASRG